MGTYKVCVYAICKNEEKFADRWMDSMGEADLVVVLDTGSEDGTAERLRARGAQVTVEQILPWRFDAARNRSLELVPEDVDLCVCTDLDEVFRPGWREALEQACGQCRNCALAETRLHVVFGDGARDAEILLVGEGPGQHEDEQGVPFVGPAGKLLDDMLEIIGLDRTKVYVANIVKCRPPKNRDPLNVEQDACIGWLRRQTALLRPKLIVCLGRIAAKAIIKEDFKITAEHGKWFQRGGVQMTAIYHPSALLRDVEKRPETFVDLKAIQAKVREICTHTDC